jgi:acyl dehydratase
MSGEEATPQVAAASLLGEAPGWIGRSYDPVSLLVSELDILRYVYAVGEEDIGMFVDRSAAHQAGMRGLVAPHGYHVVLRGLAQTLVSRNKIRPDGRTAEVLPPIPITRVMAGETELKFYGHIIAGDTITISRTMVDAVQKNGRGGPMVVLTWRLDYTNQLSERLVEEISSLIVR